MRTKYQPSSHVFFFSVIFLFYFHITFSDHAYGVWSDDPTVNTPICTANEDQSGPRIMNDGSGGAIITWGDSRSGNFDIYAQRVNSAGVAQWTADGVAICTAGGDQKVSGIISDGSGGAIIAWSDAYATLPDNIYAQRVNSAGVSQWTADGVAIRTAIDWEYDAQIISDGSGGAIITWGDNRNGNFDIYAQRINSSGVAQWTADGVAVCTASGDQLFPKIISDGSRGAIIAWRDNRSGVRIYTQRIDKYGVTQWTVDGVAVCMASDGQFDHQIISDGSVGAIITWDDDRNGNWDIYAQRVNYKGAMEWTANGVAISASSGSQNDSQIVMDGTGGGVIIWEDYRNGYGGDIYTQRIDKYGVTQWTLDGVAVCTAYFEQTRPVIINDGSGATIITWSDDRRWGDYDIYAQKVKKDGTLANPIKSLSILPLLLLESNN